MTRSRLGRRAPRQDDDTLVLLVLCHAGGHSSRAGGKNEKGFSGGGFAQLSEAGTGDGGELGKKKAVSYVGRCLTSAWELGTWIGCGCVRAREFLRAPWLTRRHRGG